MPVVAAVLHVRADLVELSTLQRELLAQPGVSLGESLPRGIPLVFESTSFEEDREFWNWLKGRTGVEHFSVVYADISDLTESQAPEGEGL